jgi:hypothetical protein
MAETLTIELHDRQQAWSAMNQLVFPFLKECLQSGRRWVLTLKLETRTQAQNRLMWPLLTEFSKQLQWPINGHMVNMEPEDWKDVLTAAFKRETVRLTMGLDGGVVMLGQRTSKFTKPEFSEWIEFLFATAAQRGVNLPAMAEGWDE